MKLLELGALKWQVLAVCDHRDQCNVLASLIAIGSPGAHRMLGTLRNYIPEYGPDFRNIEKVKNLGDGIYSLREQPKKGPKPRVFFFKDGATVIVATEATAKRDDDISGFIRRAKDIRARYMQAKTLGQLQIERWEKETG
jgi:hypothetical protein